MSTLSESLKKKRVPGDRGPIKLPRVFEQSFQFHCPQLKFQVLGFLNGITFVVKYSLHL